MASAYTYETSQVFAKLKKVEETIQRNWSTEQYLNALDELISHMLEHIVRSSDFVDQVVAGIIAWHSDTANNKISPFDKVEAIQYLMAFLTRKTADEKLLVLRRLKLDRTIPLLIAEQWLHHLKGYRRCCEDSVATPSSLVTASALEKLVLHKAGHSSLYAAIASVTYWRDQVVALRTQICEKYYRMLLGEAKGYYDLMEHSVDLDDTIQAMFLETSRAVDKCNQEKGTITTYLQRWLRFSRSKMNTEKDTAFSVPGVARDGDFSYKSVNIESLSETLDSDDTSVEDMHTQMHVRKIARVMDPLGVGRHSLDIEEYTPPLVARHIG
jgi:hypothetical protein